MSQLKAKKITQAQLLLAVSDADKKGSSVRYGFILGAGASVASGIPSGYKLASKWYEEIEESIGEDELKIWTDSIDGFDIDNIAASYTKILKKRFEVDYHLGYQELQRHMDNAKPSIGYSFLAQVLDKTSNKFVITTNFDTMTEDALFELGNAKPLVLGHEVLSKFINAVSPTRPTIIKIHRDFLFDPYNTDEEIEELDKQWQESLEPVLTENAMIVLGYGGNDESLMNYLNDIENRKPIYWCYREEYELSDRIKVLLTEKDFVIKITSFDKFMLLLSDKLNFKVLIDQENIEESMIVKSAIINAKLYAKQLEELTKEELSPKEQKAIKKLLPSWWDYELKVREETNNDKKDEIYQEAIAVYPDSAALYGNYALFCNNTQKDSDKAEEYYLKALELEPNDATYNGNYAIFLYNLRKNNDEVEEYYLKALKLDSNHANNNGGYANFLTNIRKDYDKAEECYLKALKLEPNNTTYNGNYANFLQSIRKDHDKAKEYYYQALVLDPNNIFNNGNYAQLLLEKGQKKEAIKYMEMAFENHETENDLTMELWFYRLAHYPEYFDEAQNELDRLLSGGIRSIGWNFEGNIERAEKDGFKDMELLNEYAKKITEE